MLVLHGVVDFGLRPEAALSMHELEAGCAPEAIWTLR